MMGPILLRADASTTMGTGHVMRCLALAQAWQDAGGQAVFLTAGGPSSLESRLTAEGCRVERLAVEAGGDKDARQTAERAARLAASWVVVDGYHFSGDYQRRIGEAGLRVLAIDDYGHAGHYSADLVLNQNLTAHEELYASRGPRTRLLLGTRYALLRREFVSRPRRKRRRPDVARRVLVTLGGSDPDDVTSRVVKALGRVTIDGLVGIVVVGASNPHRSRVEAVARACGVPIELQANVSNMAALMDWADVVITAGGSTVWEVLACGLTGVLLPIADNQLQTAKELGARGLFKVLRGPVVGSPDQLARELEEAFCSPDLRRRVGEAREVDGLGASRVVQTLLTDGGRP